MCSIKHCDICKSLWCDFEIKRKKITLKFCETMGLNWESMTQCVCARVTRVTVSVIECT